MEQAFVVSNSKNNEILNIKANITNNIINSIKFLGDSIINAIFLMLSEVL